MVEKKPHSLAKNETQIMITAELSTTCLEATLVIAMQEMFSEYEVIPPPVPNIPAKQVARPSIATPRLMACFGGEGASESCAQAK